MNTISPRFDNEEDYLALFIIGTECDKKNYESKKNFFDMCSAPINLEKKLVITVKKFITKQRHVKKQLTCL